MHPVMPLVSEHYYTTGESRGSKDAERVVTESGSTFAQESDVPDTGCGIARLRKLHPGFGADRSGVARGTQGLYA